MKKQKEMVKYWKTKDSVQAKVILLPEGHYGMQMEGEKYPFPGFPRGVLLFGNLSPLKHWIKNKIFNDSWRLLDEGKNIIPHIRNEALPYIWDLAEKTKYDMLPYEKLCPAVKEIYRAFTEVYNKTKSENVKKLRDVMCFILQEDDAYRFRVQWLFKFFKWSLFRKPILHVFDFALANLEHAEVVGDMKERQRLLRRVLLAILKDKRAYELFSMFMKELDFKKVKLSKADKYFFRAKYFKVDYPEDEY